MVANCPPGQAAHVEAAWPEKYPAAQPVQLELPGSVVNWPPGHDVQTVFAEMPHAAEMYCPAPHDAQPEQAVLPAVVVNCPPGHTAHTVLTEVVHAAEMYCPAPQGAQPEQAVLPVVVVNWPPGHDVQVVSIWP